MENSQNNKLSQLLDQIKVSPEVSEIAESMREDIHYDINRRITAAGKRTLWLKIASVAASVALLFGISGYLFFQEGYKRINNSLITLTNPPGTKSSVTLNDGTNITLNAATTMIYPSAFVSKNREVEIDGEAFFDVTPDASHPFIVKAGEISVRVLGTSFNVKAYAEDSCMEITLTKGSVEVGSTDQAGVVRLTPGQQAIFNKTSKTFRKQTVNTNYYASWKEGNYYFKGIALKDIARQLERNFNVKISIMSARLGQTLLTGDFTKGENLEQMLKVLTMDKRIGYEIKKENIILYEK